MTLDGVLQGLIQHLDFKGDGTLTWEQVREWPEGAVEIFQNAGWIKTKAPAQSLVCPGCEESCFMPVHVSQELQENPIKAYVACDRRDDMGRIPIPPEMLQQWQITEYQVAQWLAREMGLHGKPKRNQETGTIDIGHVQGKKATGLLKWNSESPIILQASVHSLALVEAVYFQDNQLQVDQKAIIKMVDRPPTETKGRYLPSNARSEARKLNTQEMYKSWQKAYRELKKSRRNMSDTWYSQQIAKMDVAQDRSAETIRRKLKM